MFEPEVSLSKRGKIAKIGEQKTCKDRDSEDAQGVIDH